MEIGLNIINKEQALPSAGIGGRREKRDVGRL